ncbi:N-acetylmuramoyl-L-alanine amidase [Marininema mesophilum]|uniref:N-acetylmuramoyl-L-alanine amidase n=1 Tax=Marininema mesophilum TaxID=1048340 RepID=A0A1H2SF68_9BACL|nr:N-acetylmuramoyl-L-alanine amidase [Marininema mesophilum]SDW30286.1 N-acetylmuramoyl-L-alanine amidase [Marininema mesophilum]
MVKIVVDPGHGGNDLGVVVGDLREKDLTLQLSLRMRGYLMSRYRVHVCMTRTTDRTLSLLERVAYANQLNADFFCSLHINSGGEKGWESYVKSTSTPNAYLTAQHRLHSKVMSLLEPYKIIDRGEKQADFYVLRYTRMPGVLLESLFIDTMKERRYLQNHSFMTTLAHAMGEGVARALQLSSRRAGIVYRIIAGSFLDRDLAVARQRFLRLGGIESIIMNVGLSQKYYQVQAGAFQVRSNAEARLQRIQRMGLTHVFIG